MNEQLLFEGHELPGHHKSTFMAYGVAIICTLFFGAVVLLPMLLIKFLTWKTTKYKITSVRIQLEKGLITRQINNLEMWRINDIQFQQGMLQRLFSEASLVLITQDKINPIFTISGLGLTATRELFDKLQPAISQARKDQKIVSLSA
jgi:membrane protein YdbS with pleckstrin-like domain